MSVDKVNEPIVYKTKNCAILSMYFQLEPNGEVDSFAGGGGAGRALGRAMGKSLVDSFIDRDSPDTILASNTIALADAFNQLIDEGWTPQSPGFGGAGSGRTNPTHAYIFIQIFIKSKK